jgi:hypothetical protein
MIAPATALLVAATLGLTQDPPSTIIIRHVTVVPMVGPAILPDHAVLLRDGRIAVLGPDADVRAPRGARRAPARAICDRDGRTVLRR